MTDVRALNYPAYEGFPEPKCGLEGAASICGEVVRRAAGFEWVIAHSGLWFIASLEDDWPRVAICPLVRLQELEYAATPQFGRYFRFVSQAALECLAFGRPDLASILCEMIAADEDFIHHLEELIEKTRLPGRAI